MFLILSYSLCLAFRVLVWIGVQGEKYRLEEPEACERGQGKEREERKRKEIDPSTYLKHQHFTLDHHYPPLLQR